MDVLLCAIIGGFASLLGIVMKKTSKKATILLCLVGFIFLSIAVVLFWIDYSNPDKENGDQPDSNQNEIHTSVELSPLTPTPEPTLSPIPETTDKVIILGIDLPPYPCEETVDEYGPGLHYPEKSEYLMIIRLSI